MSEQRPGEGAMGFAVGGRFALRRRLQREGPVVWAGPNDRGPVGCYDAS